MGTPFDHIFNLPVVPVIVFEDYYLAVLQKPFGYSVERHPNYPSLEDFFLKKLEQEFPGRKKHFTGIVHRLDVSTAGLVVLAKTPQALKHLNKQFEERNTVKKYMACTEGNLEQRAGSINGFITEDKTIRKATFSLNETKGSKKSVLHYTVREERENFSLLEILLDTGRFHQIRASLSFLGHPIVNDIKYGAKKITESNKIWLCAFELQFQHPKTNESIAFTLNFCGSD